MCLRGIDFASFYDIFIGFWNCVDSVVFSGLGTVWTVWYLVLELCGQCGIFWFWNCVDSVVFSGFHCITSLMHQQYNIDTYRKRLIVHV